MQPIKIAVVGHRPPPVTGENLCLLHLEKELRSLGINVSSRKRLFVSNFFLFGEKIWFVPGATLTGHFRDVLLLIWWRFLGCDVSLYIHNISWKYFIRGARFWKAIAAGKLRFVVLTDFIAEKLTQSSLAVVRLDNTLPQGLEPVESSPPVQYRLIWMSALMEEKGLDVACSVIAALSKLDPRWHMDVYGEGPGRSMVADVPNIRFHGFANEESKERALSSGGIMLLPSRYKNETQPLVIIEAMSRGIPVVSSRIGGVPVMLGQGTERAGVCLDMHASMENWIAAVLEVHSRYADFSLAARKRYIEEYSRSVYRRRIHEIVGLNMR